MKLQIVYFFPEAQCLLCLKENSVLNLISLWWSFKDLKIKMETEGRLNGQPCLFNEL